MHLLPKRLPNVPEPASTAVADECEAFLAGTLAEHLASEIAPPVWTWLNAVAHGDAEVIRRLAACTETDVRSTTTRTIASAVLADGVELVELQRDVLVPLELAHVGEVMTPRRLVELVGRALYDS